MVNNIYDLLQRCFIGSEEDFELIFCGNDTKRYPSYKKIINDETLGKISFTEEDAWNHILASMVAYLDECYLSVSIRQIIWEIFNGWLMEVAKELNMQSRIKDIEEEMPRPIEEDYVIEMIKRLHYDKDRGMAKEELTEDLHISTKTAKDLLNKLDNKKKNSELRIAGQRIGMNLKEKYVYEDNRRIKCFSAGSTINPVFLQFDIAQIHSLINGCKCAYFSEGRNMALYTAIEIWSQLSDYTRERILKVYTKRDKELEEFIELIKTEARSRRLHSYYSELELVEEGELSYEEEAEINKKLRS